ncbi:MAG: oligoribonuclease [Gammaproteobacteria bacterium]|nr:oligoribonuclease [Gammaproteobacteria bacterium]
MAVRLSGRSQVVTIEYILGVALNQKQTTPWIWIDLEMTGLDSERDAIIEIATIVTDEALQTIAEGPVIAIHQEESVLAKMDSWNREHHGSSGLLQRVRQSGIDLQQAERETLTFLRQYLKEGESPMCGNSICQDRRFLVRWMPQLEQFFHYRNLDVSTLKILARTWYRDAIPPFSKGDSHLALMDIRESIAELRFYRQQLLK